jgi:hypothetical protein
MKPSLEDVRLLKAEAEENHLRPDHHQVAKLKEIVQHKLSRYQRMLQTINSMTTRDQVTESLFIGRFLHIAALAAVDDLTEENHEKTVSSS